MPDPRSRSTYDRALDMLEARARGSEELRRLLIRKGEPADDVGRAIERLQANGLLDDAAFAHQFVRTKLLSAGHSRRRVKQELTRRGITADVSSVAIDAVCADEAVDDGATIERVARKKVRTLSKLDPLTQRRRLYAFLARRGYDADDIQRTLSAVLTDGADGLHD